MSDWRSRQYEQIYFRVAFMPTENNINDFSKYACHCGTGPDGIPYCAWAAAGASGARQLRLVLWELLNGRDAPDGFYHSRHSRLKRTRKDEAQRAAADTCPLDLNVLTTSAWVCKFTWPIAKWAPTSQRGFVHDWNGSVNVVDIDTLALILYMTATTNDIPAIKLHDFAAAFRTVDKLGFLKLEQLRTFYKLKLKDWGITSWRVIIQGLIQLLYYSTILQYSISNSIFSIFDFLNIVLCNFKLSKCPFPL